jgi:phenylalanyl-tRNA synthetase beta chain
MGGLETEVDENTRSILLESANFNLISIRRTSQALKLPSEASQRFGRGIHPALSEPAVRRATEMMRQVAGGTIARGMVDAYPVKPKDVVIELTVSEVERSLGIRFELKEIIGILERLEFRCEAIDQEAVRVVVPDHRLDCEYPADLIEEVARIYGYDRIPVTEMADRLPPQRANRGLEMEEEIRNLLVGCGLQEVVTYSLTNPEREAALDPGKLAGDLEPGSYVTLANPISQDRLVMRRSLLATVLETAAANLRFRDRVQIFELGKVFLLEPGEELPEEPKRLVVVMTGPRGERHWLEEVGPDLDYFDLKGVVETVLARLHVQGASYEPGLHPSFQPGRTARLLAGGGAKDGNAPVDLGVVGELRPAVREAFGLPQRRVAAAELNLEALLSVVPSAWYVDPISPYPAVLQDLAIIVDEGVASSAAERLIAEAGGFLLKDVQLFDVYGGDPIPPGKKSLAFALTFQAPDKTLTDAIVSRQVQRIVKRLESELGAALRG